MQTYEEFAQSFIAAVPDLTLHQKHIITSRYLIIVKAEMSEYKRVSLRLDILVNFALVSSVILTALVGINRLDMLGDSGEKALFWIILGVSVMLTIATRLLHSSNLQKRNVFARSAVEKLLTEGWKYVAKVDLYRDIEPTYGSYDDGTRDADSDVNVKFRLFCERVEAINMKIIENVIPPGGDPASEGILAGSAARANAIRNQESRAILAEIPPRNDRTFESRRDSLDENIGDDQSANNDSSQNEASEVIIIP